MYILQFIYFYNANVIIYVFYKILVDNIIKFTSLFLNSLNWGTISCISYGIYYSWIGIAYQIGIGITKADCYIDFCSFCGYLA